MVNINMRVEIFLMLTLNVFGQSAPQSQSVINFGRFPIPNEEDFYQPDQNYRPENSGFSQNYGNSENYEQSQQQNQQSNFLPTTQKSPSREPGEISQTSKEILFSFNLRDSCVCNRLSMFQNATNIQERIRETFSLLHCRSARGLKIFLQNPVTN